MFKTAPRALSILDGMTLRQMLNGIDGRVVLPGEPGWDAARASWNLAVDQRPAAVVEAASVEDVQAV
ncbi:MAG TPA: hypothetical protein VFZ00_20575, partial [Solirubrobacter sp.]|nr:hypothetical protein [Solirubrobacter sp.]